MNYHTFCFIFSIKIRQLVCQVIRPSRAGISIVLPGNSVGSSWDHFWLFTLTWHLGLKTFFPITVNTAKFEDTGLQFSMLFPCLK